MVERQKVLITKLPTGVPGLDAVLGGGLPEYSFNLIAGAPGTGKTTLVQQIMFANSSPERRALYFTVLGEPPLKMLRYQQQFEFFDLARVDTSIRFVNLSQEALARDLATVLEVIVREVEAFSPTLVVVDSFRTVVRAVAATPDERVLGFQDFLQRLAQHLTSWQATTFLIGEYPVAELQDNPVFTVADGIIWLEQSVERNSSVRKLHIVKMRGQATLPGLHTMRITEAGVQIFPRIMRRELAVERPREASRQLTGVAGLDGLLGGGIPRGDAVLVAGPSGSGKSVLATQFIAEGVARDEPGVIVVFEERPSSYIARAQSLGLDLEGIIRQGKLEIIYLRPLDLSVDEALLEILAAVQRRGAQRLAIDSLSGFELALAPTFRTDFRESLYRLVGELTSTGVTVLMTIEIIQSFASLQFSQQLVSFLADDIILLNYVELDGQLRKVLTAIKMRGSQHSKDLRTYDITNRGLVVGDLLRDYRGILTGDAQQLQA